MVLGTHGPLLRPILFFFMQFFWEKLDPLLLRKTFFLADLVVKSIVLTTNKGNVLKTPTEPDETSDNYSVVRGQDLMYLSGNTDFTNAHFPHLTFTFAKCP